MGGKTGRHRWQPVWLALGTHALLVTVGTIDALTGRDYTLSLVYLGPVLLTAWHGGPVAVTVISISTAVVWIAVDFLASRVGTDLLAHSWNFLSRLATLALVGLMLSRLRRGLRHERELARTDPLTSLLNRRALCEAVESELARCSRNGASVTLIYIDVDRFKGLNDTRGHEAGDAALVAIGRELRSGVRRSDTVARIGGDEFAILLCEVDDDRAARVVPQIHQRLKHAAAAHCWPIGFSVGAATTVGGLISAERLLSAADTLMYSVKSAARDGVALGTVEPGSSLARSDPPQGS